MQSLPLLSLSVWTPIAFGILILLLGRESNAGAMRWLALVGAAVGLLVTVPLVTGFHAGDSGMQFVENAPWIQPFNIRYALGIDGISLWFLPLTAFITLITVIAGWEVIQQRVALYNASFLILSGLMNGVFCATDAILFYVFFEATLIPMYLIIGIWGGPRRVYAAFKFFLYTLAGSLLMLVALLYLYFQSGGSFAIADWYAVPLKESAQVLLFVAFFFAFAVKIPMWPVHTWLPDAHVEAPTGGSIVLAAIMLKLGAYGFVRFVLPILPDASHALAPLIITLSVIAVIYIGLVAMVQTDMKKLVAYSSIAHMGFVTLGFFLFSDIGVQGGIVQMISHGFVSGAMFTCIGVMYDRLHTRLIKDYGGVINVMPWFGFFYVLFAMANCGLPGTSGFVGEFMVVLASFKANPWIAFFAAFTLIIGAAYTLWLVKRVLWGEIHNPHVAEMKDINGRETFVLLAFAALTLALGIWPEPLIHLMDSSVAQVVQQLAIHKI